MKKITCILSLLLFSHCLTAQKKLPVSDQKIKDTIKPGLVLVNNDLKINPNIVLAPAVRVYERPDYQGRSAQFKKNAEGKFEFPFPLRNVSFKVPEGMLVYIQTCFEFPSEVAYKFSQRDINLEGICGIRTDEVTLVKVILTGISTEIHNDDCKRFGGTILIRILENVPGISIETMLPSFNKGPTHSPDRYTYSPWFEGGQLTSRNFSTHYNHTGTIFNNNPVPVLTEQMHDFFGHVKSYASNTFYVGKKALQEGRVKIWIKTDLISAHKTCGICDDFSSNIKMDAPAYESIPLKKPYGDGKIIDAAHPLLVMGPYRASGSRDGFAITASAGTVKNFRVHLKVTGL